MLCYVTLHHVMLYYVILRCVMMYYVLLCCVVLCYVVISYVILCHVTLWKQFDWDHFSQTPASLDKQMFWYVLFCYVFEHMFTHIYVVKYV